MQYNKCQQRVLYFLSLSVSIKVRIQKWASWLEPAIHLHTVVLCYKRVDVTRICYSSHLWQGDAEGRERTRQRKSRNCPDCPRYPGAPRATFLSLKFLKVPPPVVSRLLFAFTSTQTKTSIQARRSSLRWCHGHHGNYSHGATPSPSLWSFKSLLSESAIPSVCSANTSSCKHTGYIARL